MGTETPVTRWHQLIADFHPAGLEPLLADDVVFHSPVVHAPQAGKAITRRYLEAAFKVFLNPSFRYVRQIVGANDAVLEFQVEIDGVTVNGVDMMSWNSEGRITDFKVMIRPLKAIQLIHANMAAMLEARGGQ